MTVQFSFLNEIYYLGAFYSTIGNFFWLKIVRSKRHYQRQILKIFLSLGLCFCQGQRWWWWAGAFLPSSCAKLESLWLLVFCTIGCRLVMGCWEVFCGLWGHFRTEELFYIIVCHCMSLYLWSSPALCFWKLLSFTTELISRVTCIPLLRLLLVDPYKYSSH